MKTTSFDNARLRAEGTIARAWGGRKSWDEYALRREALRAMAGEPAKLGGGMSPGAYSRMAEAFRKVHDRARGPHREQAVRLLTLHY